MADDAEALQDDNHPRHLPPLVGHEKAVRLMAGAIASGRMHHAWLFCGPRGIGKATLAYRLAAHLLSGGKGEGGRLDVDPGSSAARWMASHSHPDLFVLERAYDRKARKLKSEIAVGDARELLQFFSLTAGASRWRIAIIDTADELNQESANTLLKIMEEPPPYSLLILVSSQPGSLLRTIRSRCSRLDLTPLSEEETRLVLGRQGGVSEQADADQLEVALRLAKGSPGVAVELLSSAGAKSFAALIASPSLSPNILIDIGSRFGARNSTVDDYEVFWSLLEGWLAERARDQVLRGQGDRLAEAARELSQINRETLAFNLDRRHAVIKALSLVDQAEKAG